MVGTQQMSGTHDEYAYVAASGGKKKDKIRYVLKNQKTLPKQCIVIIVIIVMIIMINYSTGLADWRVMLCKDCNLI